MNWVRQLPSGQEVPYNGLPYFQVVALALALDEWAHLVRKRYGVS